MTTRKGRPCDAVQSSTQQLTTLAAHGKSLISIPALQRAREAALMAVERAVEGGEGRGGEGRSVV